MIEIEDATFTYAGLERSGIADINLAIDDGECVLLCGASGCGKTTVTRLINGLVPHFFKGELTGKITVNGNDIGEKELYDLAGIVGSVFQNPRSQFFSVDTDGEIVFGPENIGIPKDGILERKAHVINAFNLESLMNRSLFELSGGEKQKIACGSVAALLPEIIILDEPSSNLDWDSIRDLRNIIELWKSQGKTVIVSEHRLWYLKDVIDRAVYMENGRIVHEWDRERFSAMDADELAAFELRPVDIEERYMAEFSAPVVPPSGSADSAEPLQSPGRPDASAPDAISIRDFYFTYTPRKYLFVKKKLTPDDADICTIRIPRINVRKGEVCGIIGRNGSGKSTFLRCLCGLEKTCIGSVEIGGRAYAGKKLANVCYLVMQDVNHQLFTDSVISEVMLSMDDPDEAAAMGIFDELDLLEFKDKHPMALSGGQKQRVAIASALASNAEILLFDEPTSGLDYGHMKEVSQLLRDIAGSDKAVFVSTHDPEFLAECCDRTILIVDGAAREIR